MQSLQGLATETCGPTVHWGHRQVQISEAVRPGLSLKGMEPRQSEHPTGRWGGVGRVLLGTSGSEPQRSVVAFRFVAKC